MAHGSEHLQILRELLDGQLLGVLGTHHDGEPYSSLVAFAATGDLTRLVFVTGRATRKFSYLSDDARASFLVDNRSNRPRDFAAAAAATAVGVVEELHGTAAEEASRLFLARHPQLAAFVHAPTSVILRLSVARYQVVVRFQDVVEIVPTP